MATLKRVRCDTRQGQKLLRRLETRGSALVETKIVRQTRRILKDIAKSGDEALLKYVKRYDGVEATRVSELRLTPVDNDAPRLPDGFERALERSIEAVARFHRRQTSHEGFRLEEDGVILEERRLPLRRVGIYVPGGRFPYPSSVVMSVVPATLAGVEQIVVVTPPRAWQDSAALRFTLERLGVYEVWGMGGAHAIGALAFGTESIDPVDLIAGPGNAWVTAAKQLVSGRVGVDRDAGPSEVVIVADREADPEWVAADLLAQAEHDPQALAILVTPDSGLAKRVTREVEKRLSGLSTAETARAALSTGGVAFLVSDLEEALDVAERIAPEHMQLMGPGAEKLADRVRHAGALFVGSGSPVVLGDYVAGPSHVLPTGGTARFSSGLGVDDFVRRSHTVQFGPEASTEWARDAAVLASVEGLEAHERSARLRVGDDGAVSEGDSPPSSVSEENAGEGEGNDD